MTALLVTGCARTRPDGDAGQAQRTGQIDNATTESLVQMASEAEKEGNLAAAAKLYRRAQKANEAIDRKNPAPLIGLGRVMAALGGHDEAADAYRAALRMKSKQADALRGLGTALIALGQPLVARDQFVAALEVRKDARAYNGLGVAYDMMKDHETAQTYYRTGLELAPEDPALRSNLGLSLVFSGDVEEGIAILREVSDGRRTSVRNRLNLALAYGLAGDARAAADTVPFALDEAAMARRRGRGETLHTLREAWTEQGGSRMATRRSAAGDIDSAKILAEPDDAPAPSNMVADAAGARPVASVPLPARAAFPLPAAIPVPILVPVPAAVPAVTGKPLGLIAELPAAGEPAADGAPGIDPMPLPSLSAYPADTANGGRPGQGAGNALPDQPQIGPAAGDEPATAAGQALPSYTGPAVAVLPAMPVPAPPGAGALTRQAPLPGVATDAAVPLSVPVPAPATVPAPAAAPAPEPQLAALPNPAARRYQVQLAAYGTRAAADSGWKWIVRKAPDLLGGMRHVVQEARVGPQRKLFFRLRTTPFADRRQAQDLCDRLDSRGVACLVVEQRG